MFKSFSGESILEANIQGDRVCVYITQMYDSNVLNVFSETMWVCRVLVFASS